MAAPFVISELSDGILTLTLNRPEERNAIATHEDCLLFAELVEALNDRPEVRCVIMTGAGMAFSAGGNIKAMKERNGIGPLASPVDTRANYRRGVQRVIRALWECEVPMIAAVNGAAVGLGCDLACLCDIRLASDKAKFASSFINLGIVPGDGGAWILPRAVGLSKASEMIFTGDTISAAEALECGLVSSVLSPDALLPAANALAARITSRPAKTLRLAKRLIREAQHLRLTDVLELSAAYQALAHETEDHQEAVQAFLDKRLPQFNRQ